MTFRSKKSSEARNGGHLWPQTMPIEGPNLKPDVLISSFHGSAVRGSGQEWHTLSPRALMPRWYGKLQKKWFLCWTCHSMMVSWQCFEPIEAIVSALAHQLWLPKLGNANSVAPWRNGPGRRSASRCNRQFQSWGPNTSGWYLVEQLHHS